MPRRPAEPSTSGPAPTSPGAAAFTQSLRLCACCLSAFRSQSLQPFLLTSPFPDRPPSFPSGSPVEACVPGREPFIKIRSGPRALLPRASIHLHPSLLPAACTRLQPQPAPSPLRRGSLCLTQGLGTGSSLCGNPCAPPNSPCPAFSQGLLSPHPSLCSQPVSSERDDLGDVWQATQLFRSSVSLSVKWG